MGNTAYVNLIINTFYQYRRERKTTKTKKHLLPSISSYSQLTISRACSLWCDIWNFSPSDISTQYCSKQQASLLWLGGHRLRMQGGIWLQRNWKWQSMIAVHKGWCHPVNKQEMSYRNNLRISLFPWYYYSLVGKVEVSW